VGRPPQPPLAEVSLLDVGSMVDGFRLSGLHSHNLSLGRLLVERWWGMRMKTPTGVKWMIFLFPSDGIDPVQDTSVTIRIVIEKWGAQELYVGLAGCEVE
jgi:hypothetical protein